MFSGIGVSCWLLLAEDMLHIFVVVSVETHTEEFVASVDYIYHLHRLDIHIKTGKFLLETIALLLIKNSSEYLLNVVLILEESATTIVITVSIFNTQNMWVHTFLLCDIYYLHCVQ